MTGFAEALRWTALVMLSCVVPLGIFVGRNNIRAFRREIVRDLERLFSFASLPNGAPLIIPSFELVKYKYDPEAIRSVTGATTPTASAITCCLSRFTSS
jgi:hypothetical protein